MRFRRHLAAYWMLASLLLAARDAAVAEDDFAAQLPAAATRPVDFTRDIRPILEKSCFRCHGSTVQKSGLRLDTSSGVRTGGDSGSFFEAGNSAESLIVEYVSAIDPDFVMPPEGEPISNEDVALIRGWIDQGAVVPADAEHGDEPQRPESNHWAFQPIESPAVPHPDDSDNWVRNPIDAFVLDKLNTLGIRPSAEARRETLVRRLYLDLIGLLPSPAEAEAYVNDGEPGAYERLVDRLLVSPHFGERWGRHWLDLARYADSDGYEKDLPRPYAYRWRDWVIEAFNSDLPFDKFTEYQLAGDLLPNGTLETQIATGFHRNTLTNREGGADPEEFRDKAVIDRVNTTASVWLGLTMGCAECHSHKYDPLTQREYYQLFAFFNSADEKDISSPLECELAEYRTAKQTHDRKLAKLQRKVDRYVADTLPARFAEWSESPVAATQWHTIRPDKVRSAAGAGFAPQPDGSYLAVGETPPKDEYRLEIRTDLRGITGFQLELLPDPTLPNGLGRAQDGICELTEVTLEVKSDGDPKTVRFRHPWTNLAPDKEISASETNFQNALDGKLQTTWTIQSKSACRLYWELDQPLFVPDANTDGTAAADGCLILTLKQHHGDDGHTIGRFRVSATTDVAPFIPASIANMLTEPPQLPETVSTADEVRTTIQSDSRVETVALVTHGDNDGASAAQQREQLVAFHRSIDPTFRQLNGELQQHIQSAPNYPPTKAPILAQRKTPRETFVHLRGDFLSNGPQVQPGTPAVLNEFKPQSDSPSRLDLAHWLVDPAQPLTRRVAVNRIWMHLFGQGLVETQEDFGTQGSPPSHPELLDWLATELLNQDWSRKAVIRTIVTSAAYRQSSAHRVELADLDPKNAFVARQNRYRLEAEVVRDLYLDASGLLNREIGGPSVRPKLPNGVAELGYANTIKWNESEGGERYRRGCYVFLQRTVPYPMLITFDAPDSNVACIRRERSNTPLQALTLLNDPVFFECAQAFGQRLASEAPSDTNSMLRHAFVACLSRQPDGVELQSMLRLYQELMALDDSNLVADLAGADSGDDRAARVAAAVVLGRTLLNLDEFVTRE